MTILRLLARQWVVCALVLFSLTAAACGPAPLGVSWAALTETDDGNILVAYNDRVVLVEPGFDSGRQVELMDQGQVRLDAEGNPRLWQVLASENENTQFYSSPVMLDEVTVLIPTYTKQLLRVNLEAARVENLGQNVIPGSGHLVADPLLAGELLYVGLNERDLVAVDAEDLSVRWTFETEHGVWSEPILVDNVLYFTSLDHHLYAVDAQRGGAPLWVVDLKGAAPSTPAYQDGHLYVGSFGSRVFDISAEDGQVLAERPTKNWVWSTPALVDGILYVADLGGNVYALDTGDDLRELWVTSAATQGIRATPLVTDAYIVVGSRDHNVYWLDRETGQVITDQTRPLSAPVLSDLLLIEADVERGIEEPLVVVSTLSNSEILVAFTLERGRRQWAFGW